MGNLSFPTIWPDPILCMLGFSLSSKPIPPWEWLQICLAAVQRAQKWRYEHGAWVQTSKPAWMNSCFSCAPRAERKKWNKIQKQNIRFHFHAPEDPDCIMVATFFLPGELSSLLALLKPALLPKQTDFKNPGALYSPSSHHVSKYIDIALARKHEFGLLGCWIHEKQFSYASTVVK